MTVVEPSLSTSQYLSSTTSYLSLTSYLIHSTISIVYSFIIPSYIFISNKLRLLNQFLFLSTQPRMYAKIQKSKILTHSVDQRKQNKYNMNNTIHTYFALLKNIFNKNIFIINNKAETPNQKHKSLPKNINCNKSAISQQTIYDKIKQSKKQRGQRLVRFKIKSKEKRKQANKQISRRLNNLQTKSDMNNMILNLQKSNVYLLNDTKSSFHPIGKIYQKNKKQRCSTLVFPQNNSFEDRRQDIRISSLLIHSNSQKRSIYESLSNKHGQNSNKFLNHHQIFRIIQRAKRRQMKQMNQNGQRQNNEVFVRQERSHSVQIVTPW